MSASETDPPELIELEWGQTPWDGMSREELLRTVQRMYSTIRTCESHLLVQRSNQSSTYPSSPYWGSYGSGGRAIAKCTQSLQDVRSRFDQESVYRAFFRYADDLLFEGVGSGWGVCPECQGMYAGVPDRPTIGRLCCDVFPIPGETACTGILRPISWDDLKTAGTEGTPDA